MHDPLPTKAMPISRTQVTSVFDHFDRRFAGAYLRDVLLFGQSGLTQGTSEDG